MKVKYDFLCKSLRASRPEKIHSLHYLGLGQNQLIQEKHVNCQENHKKVGQLIKKSHKNAKMDKFTLKKRIIAK